MMSHDEASELLAVAALHAVDAETLSAIEEHATTCPRCQSELDSYRAVAAAIGNSVEELPEGLWTNISSQLWDHKGESTVMPALLIGETPADVVAIGSATRSSRRVRTALAALAFAAARRSSCSRSVCRALKNQVTHLQGVIASASRSAVQRAMATPGHKSSISRAPRIKNSRSS